MDIKFKIENQNLTRMDSERVVDWSKKYLVAVFELKGSEWVNDEHYTKYALFRHGELSFAMELTRKEPSEPIYTCIVPHEILRYSSFIITVYAAGKAGTEFVNSRVTTNSLNIKVDASDFTTDLMSTREPSKDAFTDIYEALDEKISNTEAEDKINAKVTEAIGNIRFPQVIVISDASKANPEGVVGDKGDMWFNIYSTVTPGETPTVNTTVLRFKHNGSAWEQIVA